MRNHVITVVLAITEHIITKRVLKATTQLADQMKKRRGGQPPNIADTIQPVNVAIR